jgi:hypothetical protein
MSASDLRIAHLEPTCDGGWLINFACSDRAKFRRAVDELKRLVDYRDRQYDPEARCWWLASDADLRRLDCLFPRLGEQMREAKAGGWEAPPRPSRTATLCMDAATHSAFAALHLAPDAPRYVAQAVYRVLAKDRHPDHGGATEAMRALNLAYELVCAWFDRQHTQRATRKGGDAA